MGEVVTGASPARTTFAMARSYWRKNLRVVAILLAIWAFVGLGLGVLLVTPLNTVQIGGFKLGFWFGQQGAIFVFVALIAIYAIWMDRIEAAERRQRSDGEGDA